MPRMTDGETEARDSEVSSERPMAGEGWSLDSRQICLRSKAEGLAEFIAAEFRERGAMRKAC